MEKEKTRRVWVSKETYAELEARADKLGITVDELATRYTDEMLRKLKAKAEKKN